MGWMPISGLDRDGIYVTAGSVGPLGVGEQRAVSAKRVNEAAFPAVASAQEENARLERFGVSPSMFRQLFLMFLDIDVRSILPSISVPTLILHRRGDRVVNVRAGRYLAERITGAKYVELPGIDHTLYAGDSNVVLDQVQEFLIGARVDPAPDRVLATVMFTDIVGSTERAAHVGDRLWRETLDLHDEIAHKEVERFGGRTVKYTGDGVLALFDGPARAIRCACALREATSSLGVEIRTGLHTGEVELRGEDVSGLGVNIGERVAALGEPGEILVSRTVVDLVAGSGIEFEDRGERALKGVPGSWGIYSVTG